MSALAKPQARAIPERGTLMAHPVESGKLMDMWRPQEAEGFDLSAFHRFAGVAQLTPNDFEACTLRPLGPATDLFQFDFTRPNIDPARITEDLACTGAGTIHAVLVSFRMQLAPGIQVTNGLNSGGHWGRTAFLLDSPKTAKSGDSITITAQHDASQLSLSVHDTTPCVDIADHAPVWINPAWNLRAAHPQGSDSLAPSANPVWVSPDVKDVANPRHSYH
jgi:hypothetical protein